MAQERPEALAPHAPAFVSHMLAAMQHADSDVAIEATAFWMQYLSVGLPPAALLPRLPELVERLLEHMVFEEHDEEVVAAQDAERGVVADGAQDLKPFVGGRDGEAGGPPSSEQSTPAAGGARSDCSCLPHAPPRARDLSLHTWHCGH
jgi:hypothetical protein